LSYVFTPHSSLLTPISFREAVYLLTGFRMDLYAADPSVADSLPRLRLRSMFAEKPEDCLLFQLRGDAPEVCMYVPLRMFHETLKALYPY
jgi:hypothetical protein